jgi:spore germination protein KC
MIQDPQKPDLVIPMDITCAQQPDIAVSFDGDKPVIDLKVYLDCDLLSIQSGIDYEQPELKTILEDAFKQTAAEGLKKTIEKCRRLGVDVFLFGDYAARNFLTIEAWENYNWNGHFIESRVNIDVAFIIRRTGAQIKSNPVINSEGKVEVEGK